MPKAKTRYMLAITSEDDFMWFQCRSLEQAQEYAPKLTKLGRVMVIATAYPIERMNEDEVMEVWDEAITEAQGNLVDEREMPNMA